MNQFKIFIYITFIIFLVSSDSRRKTLKYISRVNKWKVEQEIETTSGISTPDVVESTTEEEEPISTPDFEEPTKEVEQPISTPEVVESTTEEEEPISTPDFDEATKEEEQPISTTDIDETKIDKEELKTITESSTISSEVVTEINKPKLEIGLERKPEVIQNDDQNDDENEVDDKDNEKESDDKETKEDQDKKDEIRNYNISDLRSLLEQELLKDFTTEKETEEEEKENSTSETESSESTTLTSTVENSTDISNSTTDMPQTLTTIDFRLEKQMNENNAHFSYFIDKKELVCLGVLVDNPFYSERRRTILSSYGCFKTLTGDPDIRVIISSSGSTQGTGDIGIQKHSKRKVLKIGKKKNEQVAYYNIVKVDFKNDEPRYDTVEGFDEFVTNREYYLFYWSKKSDISKYIEQINKKMSDIFEEYRDDEEIDSRLPRFPPHEKGGKLQYRLKRLTKHTKITFAPNIHKSCRKEGNPVERMPKAGNVTEKLELITESSKVFNETLGDDDDDDEELEEQLRKSGKYGDLFCFTTTQGKTAKKKEHLITGGPIMTDTGRVVAIHTYTKKKKGIYHNFGNFIYGSLRELYKETGSEANSPGPDPPRPKPTKSPKTTKAKTTKKAITKSTGKVTEKSKTTPKKMQAYFISLNLCCLPLFPEIVYQILSYGLWFLVVTILVVLLAVMWVFVK